MRTEAFNARCLARRLARDYGAEIREHAGGSLLWAKFPDQKRGVFKRGWQAMHEHLKGESANREKPIKRKRPSRAGRKKAILPGVIVSVEVPRDTGEWRDAVLLQREPFVSQVIEPGPFIGHVTKSRPRLSARKESHVSARTV